MIGKQLGPYLVERELGSGGMGTVYAATLQRDAGGLPRGTRVALKIVHPHLLTTEGFFKRFLREAEIGQALSHANVVRTFDCDALDGHHFLVMEYVDGQNLRELLDELGRVPEALCRHVGREIAAGLTAVHASGAVHRDLKPDNVLITRDEVVKVMDLGVARLADEQLRLSQSGAFVGSIEYAAPEQFEGGDVDARCDLHALGVLLYELSSGRHPYRGDDFRGVMNRVCEERPRRLGDLRPELSPFFEELVHTLLAKDRAERFGSASEVVELLDAGESSAWWHARLDASRVAGSAPLRRVRVPRQTAVYGRDEELALLERLFARARDGDGQVVLVEGEAGIGKSRLVDELVARVSESGADPRFLHGGYPPGGAATAGGAFQTAFAEAVGDRGTGRHLRTMPLLVPAFDAFLRGDAVPTGAEPLSRETLQSCFVALARSLAGEQVTIVLIDDLHFAPDEGRALFTSLAMAAPALRLLLIGTLRQSQDATWGADMSRLEQVTQLPLHRLGPKDLALLLEETFRSRELAARLGHQIAVKSDGNPFFAFEIVRGLRKENLITQTAEGHWESSGEIREIEIPSSVLDLVEARLAGLDDDERALLDVAACAGFEFDPGLVGEVTGRERIAVLRAFARIERRHRLVRAEGRALVFDHHQVHEALLRNLHVQLREEYHAAIAHALEKRVAGTSPAELAGPVAVELCEHFLEGARPAAARVYLWNAQLHLNATCQLARMIELSETALAQDTGLAGEPRARVLLRLGTALHAAGNREREEEVAREAETLAAAVGSDDLESRAALAIANVCYRTARYDEAERAYLRQLEIARRSADVGTQSSALGGLGLVQQARGNLGEARRLFEDALRLGREKGDPAMEANALIWIGSTCSLEGRVVEARDHHERALEIFRATGSLKGEAISAGNLALVSAQLGDLARATELLERDIEVSRQVGYRLGEAVARYNLAEVTRCAGDLAGAERLLVACARMARELGHAHLGAAAQKDLGSVHVAAGDVERGRAELEQAAHSGFPTVDVMALCELAALPGGTPDAALAAFAEHAGRLGAADLREARWLLWRATRDETHLAEARRLLDEVLAGVEPEYHASICTNRRIDRAISEATRPASGGESETRVSPPHTPSKRDPL